MLWACPRRWSSRYAARISAVIQVPRLCGRGAAQPSITPAKSASVTTLKPPLRRVFARLRLTRNSSGKRTSRGSGDHQSTGWPGEYQGKMPRREAARSLAGERSPPAARRPGGSSSACSGGGNHSGASFGESQVIVFTACSRRGFAIGDVLANLGRVVVDGAALTLQVIADSRAEGGVGDVVRRPGEGGLEAAAHLVLALGAGLEPLHAPLDAELDPLVIAGLEMQAVILGRGSPIASVERLPRPEEDGCGHRCFPPCRALRGAMHGDFDHERIPERARDLTEEFAGQVRLVAVPQEGLAVKVIDAVEEARVEVAAEARLEADAGLGHAPALASRFLALLRRERLEVCVEARIGPVAPVELAVAAQQPTRRLADCARGLIEEEGVHRGESAARRMSLQRLEQTLRHDGGLETRAHEQARASGRREGHGNDELGIVPASIARIRLRPGEIEHELAVGVRLDIGGCRRREAEIVTQGDGAGLPSRARADTAAMLE